MATDLRYSLAPISFLYGAVLKLRNKLYDANILKSTTFNLPIICVGNLALGGTGKTPMTEYLIELLQQKYNLATLSRGYKRKTKGYVLADEKTTALEIGDEPMQFHFKYPHVAVAVGEERIVAIPQLLFDRPNTQAILLDDAFQHRPVQPSLNILLTDFNKLYVEDKLFPFGGLRDVQSSADRAQIIVVTKCPDELSSEQKNEVLQKIKPTANQAVFFTALTYKIPYQIFSKEEYVFLKSTKILMVTGIANPTPLRRFLEKHSLEVEQMQFSDHHIFRSADFKKIKETFEAIDAPHKIILTTEKDAVRLWKFKEELQNFPIYAIPIAHKFLFGEAEKFNKMTLGHIEYFPK